MIGFTVPRLCSLEPTLRIDKGAAQCIQHESMYLVYILVILRLKEISEIGG